MLNGVTLYYRILLQKDRNGEDQSCPENLNCQFACLISRIAAAEEVTTTAGLCCHFDNKHESLSAFSCRNTSCNSQLLMHVSVHRVTNLH